MKTIFTPREREYLAAHRLCRFATVSPAGQPDVAVARYTFDGTHFIVGGRDFVHTIKYANVRRGQSRVALVVDDADPNTDGPRGIKIHGHAEIVEREGHLGPGLYLQIAPTRSWSWGIEAPAFVDGRPVFQRSET